MPKLVQGSSGSFFHKNNENEAYNLKTDPNEPDTAAIAALPANSQWTKTKLEERNNAPATPKSLQRTTESRNFDAFTSPQWPSTSVRVKGIPSIETPLKELPNSSAARRKQASAHDQKGMVSDITVLQSFQPSSDEVLITLVATLTGEKSQLKQQVHAQQTEVLSLHRELTENSERLRALKAKVHSLYGLVEYLGREQSALRLTGNKLCQDVLEAYSDAEDIKATLKTSKSLMNDATATESEFSSLRQLNEILRHKNRQINAHLSKEQHRIKQLQEDLCATNVELEKLKSMHSEITADDFDKRKSLENDIIEKLTVIAERIVKYPANQDEIKQLLQNFKRYHKETVDSHRKLLEHEINRITNDNSTLIKSIEQIKYEKEELASDRTNVYSELSLARKRCAELQSALSNVGKQDPKGLEALISMRSELAQREKCIQKLRFELERAENECLVISNDKAAISDKLNLANSKISQLESNIRELNNEKSEQAAILQNQLHEQIAKHEIQLKRRLDHRLAESQNIMKQQVNRIARLEAKVSQYEDGKDVLPEPSILQKSNIENEHGTGSPKLYGTDEYETLSKNVFDISEEHPLENSIVTAEDTDVVLQLQTAKRRRATYTQPKRKKTMRKGEEL